MEMDGFFVVVVHWVNLLEWAGQVGCKPEEWKGSTGHVSSSPHGFPEPAAIDTAAAAC